MTYDGQSRGEAATKNNEWDNNMDNNIGDGKVRHEGRAWTSFMFGNCRHDWSSWQKKKLIYNMYRSQRTTVVEEPARKNRLGLIRLHA
jgi:hypothetical protein